MFLRMVLLLLSQAPAPTPQDIFQQGRFAEAAALLERGDSSSGGRYLLWLCYQQMGGVGEGGDGAGGFGWEGAEVGAGGLCSRACVVWRGKVPRSVGGRSGGRAAGRAGRADTAFDWDYRGRAWQLGGGAGGLRRGVKRGSEFQRSAFRAGFGVVQIDRAGRGLNRRRRSSASGTEE